MNTNPRDVLLDLLTRQEDGILNEWVEETLAGSGNPGDAARRTLRSEAAEVLRGIREALQSGADLAQLDDSAWGRAREVLQSLSRSRAAQGQSAADTSVFVLAFKKPLFKALQQAMGNDASALVALVWSVSMLVDRLAQWTVSAYQQSREEIIRRQQQDLLELSTPVIKLWEGVLAVPMIGTLDSSRTQIVMETLLQRIVDTGSTLAIIDITGVPTVDTLVAQHLLKTVSAIRLMGAECIISGIRPQIAQTIVHLGIDLEGIASKASLADALALALRQRGYVIQRTGEAR
ncbi:STAS domain-containing protein [Ramlibacter sp. AW1]|uniref:STAS domain-containing protein n=1 Tax=Ramlibacter aurantiacus TaxID=2801330 RepID=A0A936ZFF8_9BURK|nr:STAS domain-containing protein [Ramlibacter aurantiacus]MBL0420534.1 STAS domain-containing protein [Ramlibacter aurantiacus]